MLTHSDILLYFCVDIGYVTYYNEYIRTREGITLNRRKRWIIGLLIFLAADLVALAIVVKPMLFPTPVEATTEQAWTVPIDYETTAAPETTAPQTTAPIPENTPAEDTLTISFVGDCMFASNHGGFGSASFNRMASQKAPTYFLNNFTDLFHADDFTIANCEGVLSDSEELTEKEVTTEIAFWFKGPASNAKIFEVSGVELASVVNNHSHDFGQQGSDDTERALEAVGVLPGRRDKVTYTTVKGQKLGIFCCSLYGYDYIYDILDKLHEMQAEQCDLKILYFHGGIENETVPEDWKVCACHELIDAGADIIVGSHPHVLQPMEIYNGKPILYSMGNFCFGGNTKPPKNTIVYQAEFDLKDGTLCSRTDTLIPCAVYAGSQNNYQPYIVTDSGKQQEILRFMQTPVGTGRET